jgi:hypothetical protein
MLSITSLGTDVDLGRRAEGRYPRVNPALAWLRVEQTDAHARAGAR